MCSRSFRPSAATDIRWHHFGRPPPTLVLTQQALTANRKIRTGTKIQKSCFLDVSKCFEVVNTKLAFFWVSFSKLLQAPRPMPGIPRPMPGMPGGGMPGGMPGIPGKRWYMCCLSPFQTRLIHFHQGQQFKTVHEFDLSATPPVGSVQLSFFQAIKLE